jgi:hypothetical protein
MSADTVELAGYVGPVSLSDGAHTGQARLANSGELMASKVNPDWYENVLRGNAFVYSTAAAGVTWVAPTTTQNMPMLWNPSGSGKNFLLKRVTAGYVSGAHVPGCLELAYIPSAGSQIGTGAPIVSLTQVAGVNLNLGAGNASVMRFAPAACAVVAAPTFLCSLGVSFLTALAATAIDPFVVDVQTEILVPPGVALFVVHNVVSTIVGQIAMFGLELPIPAVA